MEYISICQILFALDTVSMTKQEFGIRLARIRLSRDLSAYELSMRLEKDPTYISKIENGKAFPSMEMFFEICKILGISHKQIFD